MKKYLFNGLLALVVGVILASCKDTSVDYVPIAQQKTQAYADVFKEMIGGEIDPNQNWGFDVTYPEDLDSTASSAGTRVGTRSGETEIIKPDMTSFPGYSSERCNSSNYRTPEGYADIIAPVTDKERAWVMDWFSNHPGLTDHGLDISNFFIQDVGNNGFTKEGYFHTTEGGRTEQITAQTYNNCMMDKLQVGSEASEAGTTHVLDYNATTGFNDWNVIYVKNGSALQFGYHESYGSSYQFKFKCVQLTVPASCFTDGQAHTGWYVGLSYYCNKHETNEKWHEIGIDRLQYADDWVLKIVPGEGEEEIENIGGGSSSNTSTYEERIMQRKRLMSQGRVFCEDLAKATREDIDFNDVVFDARLWKISKYKRTINNNTYTDGSEYDITYEAEICLLAAGGTIPLKVAGKDVHEEFGVGGTTMVNTVDENSNVTITWGNYNDARSPKKFTYDMTSIVNNSINAGTGISLNLIPIEVLWTSSLDDVKNGTMQSVGLIGANIGQVPYKLCVPIGTPWPSERVSINTSYSGFSDWAKKASSEPNWENGVKVYTGVEGLSADAKYVVGYYEDSKISSSGSSTTTSETVMWQGKSPLTFKNNWGWGNLKTLEMTSAEFNIGDVMRIYTTNRGNNPSLRLHGKWGLTYLSWEEYYEYIPSGDYNDIVITETIKDKLTKTIGFWGKNCSITKITRVRTTTTTY